MIPVEHSADHILLKSLFEDHIDKAINQEQFALAFSLSKIPELHKCILDLVKKISKRKEDEVLLHSSEDDQSQEASILICSLGFNLQIVMFTGKLLLEYHLLHSSVSEQLLLCLFGF